MKIHNDFYANSNLSTGFFSLQKLVFPHVDIQWAYENGFITQDVVPWGVFDGEIALSILNATKMQFIINGKSKKAIQIGTVATHPNHRGFGLSKQLLLKVLEEYHDQCDFIFLFANDTVLEYYPKFGFQLQAESVFRMPLNNVSNNKKMTLRKLKINENSSDMKLLKQSFLKRDRLSDQISVCDQVELAMWYCVKFYHEWLWYHDQSETLLVAHLDGKTLHIKDIAMSKIDSLFFKNLSWSNAEDVLLHFLPDRFQGDFIPEIEHSEDTLFLMGNFELTTPYVKIPELAHT